ncbi:MAG TPA: 3-hydroxyacyl-CoA dehydrogenase NAD-binding domain-containing protein [Gemmatimonadaceae bacterium]|nr:3-hydroxyacyl-CoA dehydrogenase NAD-binding domain-containing protein [Gemmatimonadaceae bacterium]
MSPDSPVGIVGAGAMGSGIAQVAATRGHPVMVVDTSAQALERAREALGKVLRREVEKGRLDDERAAAIAARIRWAEGGGTAGMDALRGSALVIEAIVERLDVKRETFAALERVVAPECVLATNTSSLSISAIAAACERPERVLGVHFFNPAPLMPLVEIIPGLATAEEVVTATRALVDAWGKTTVVAADTPGFIVNRVARPFYGEALRLYEEGVADPATIDWAMREIGGFRMGPFELMDLIGHDVNFAVTSSVFEGFFFDPRYRPSHVQQRLVAAGRLGRKTGRGFYDYAPGATRPEPVADRALGERIVERILCMLINEAADAVFLRIATPTDIDTAMTKGVNYPRGLLAWADELGAERVVRCLTTLQEEYGEDRYRPSPLLRRMAREGARFFGGAPARGGA